MTQMDKSHGLLGLALVLLLAANPGCSDGSPQEIPDAGGLDERLAPGQVRAGRITQESELIGGPEAHGWIGDYKLYNDRVAFIVEGEDDLRSFGNTGGCLLDADRVRPEGQPGRDVFQEVMPNIDLLTMRPLAMEVVNDGRNGQPASVRFQAAHRGFILVDGLFTGTLAPKDISITHEYILEPDAEFLRIRTSVRSNLVSPQNLIVGDLTLNGDEAEVFIEGKGVVTGQGFAGDLAYYAGFHPDSCSLYTGAEGPVRTGLSLEGITPLEVIRGNAPGVRSEEPDLIAERLLIVGEGPIDDCLRILRQVRSNTQVGQVQGTLSSGAEAVAGATLLALDQDLPDGLNTLNQTYSGPDGAYSLSLPAGQYRLSVASPGRALYLSEAFEVTVGGSSEQPLSLPEAGGLTCTCADGNGALPCKITFQDGLDAQWTAPTRPDLLSFAWTGAGSLPVPPGDYTLTFSRGWEYSVHRVSLTIAAGSQTQVDAVLERQVDTSGYIAADLHSHSGRSPETHFPIEDKLAANACEGVELMMATDHDCSNDFTSQIEHMSGAAGFDLGAWLVTVVGNEISPMGNHFTAFPLQVHPSGWSYWDVPYVQYQDDHFDSLLEFPDLFARARELGAQIINVAHPIGDKGYFSRLGFDPPNQIPLLADLDPALYTESFDTLEVLNSGAVGRMLDGNLPLWAALNNQGLFRTASGVSDAHTRHDTPGNGRTMVASSTDAPAQIDLEEIWANLKAGHAMVGGGYFITISIKDHGPGELVSSPAPLSVHLQVQAADWVPVGEVILLGNAEELARLPLEAPGVIDPARPALRFDGDIQVSPTNDTWYAGLAVGPSNPGMRPVIGSQPVGLTNAVRVDVDGNGSFDPPGRP